MHLIAIVNYTAETKSGEPRTPELKFVAETKVQLAGISLGIGTDADMRPRRPYDFKKLRRRKQKFNVGVDASLLMVGKQAPVVNKGANANFRKELTHWTVRPGRRRLLRTSRGRLSSCRLRRPMHRSRGPADTLTDAVLLYDRVPSGQCRMPARPHFIGQRVRFVEERFHIGGRVHVIRLGTKGDNGQQRGNGNI